MNVQSYGARRSEPENYEKTILREFDDLLLSGRMIAEKGKLHLDWTYSGFSFRGWFDGELLADVKAEGQLGYLFHIEVDGVDTVTRYDLGEGIVLLAKVEKGYHTVTVRKTTEGVTAVVTLRALIFNGVLDVKPEVPRLRLEFVGDSITCGVGAKSKNVTAEDWDFVRDCDSYHSYSTMTARALGADAHLTSVSGWGIIHGSTDHTQKIPAIYELTSYLRSREIQWDFSSYQPDIIVIALGTNDINAPENQKKFYGKAASDFLKTVRKDNPSAYIVWMYGMMNLDFAAAIKDAVAQQKDERILYLDQPLGRDGGWGHPSLTMQTNYAQRLTALLKFLLGDTTTAGSLR